MKVLTSLLAALALALVIGCQSAERSEISAGAMSDGSGCSAAMCGGCSSAGKEACASEKAPEADMGALSDDGGACARPCPEHAQKHPECDPRNCDPRNCASENCDPAKCDPKNCDKPDCCAGR
ncbi:MAG: hypothetical protein SYC29_11490 [Planctomycetota bacterium]|nr:hypothetical protein [Planctomycetota bacterium]